MALEPGTSGEEVTQLQQQLANMGFQSTASGTFDQATAAVVAQFQELFGLGQTGQADDTTLAAVQERVDAGYGQEDYGEIGNDSPSPAEAELPELA
jgi:peptidoglycan hydrolase-like protein with peptidoglycan-binding domain